MKNVLFVLFGVLILIGCSSYDYKPGDVIEPGTYTFGKEINPTRYMFDLNGPGTILITDAVGNEKFFLELEEGDHIHFHSLPIDRGDILQLTDGFKVVLY